MYLLLKWKYAESHGTPLSYLRFSLPVLSFCFEMSSRAIFYRRNFIKLCHAILVIVACDMFLQTCRPLKKRFDQNSRRLKTNQINLITWFRKRALYCNCASRCFVSYALSLTVWLFYLLISFLDYVLWFWCFLVTFFTVFILSVAHQVLNWNYTKKKNTLKMPFQMIAAQGIDQHHKNTPI